MTIASKPKASRVVSTCRHCGKEFSQPRSRLWRDKFCSPACGTAQRRAMVAGRARRCATCGSEFTPRPTQLRAGAGKHCSQKCKATRKRRTETGKAADSVRRYRKLHPEKVSEWGQNRRGIGHVPKGAIARLLEQQRGLCTYCTAELPPYHVDHKLPVARGGTNAEHNLHLTCPRCNMRKGALTHEEFLVSKRRRVILASRTECR